MKQKILFAMKYFMLLFTVACIICLTIFLTIENNAIDTKVNEIKFNEEVFVKLKSDHIVESFLRAITDLKYVSEDFDRTNQENRIIWKTILDSSGAYSSISYVTLNGNNILTQGYLENINPTDRHIDVKNIASETYFQNAIRLKEGQFFVSKLINEKDDNGSSKSSIMFCTPVYFAKEIVGILILEYDAKAMMYRFGNHISNTEGIVYLISDYGYWDSLTKVYRGIDPYYYTVSYDAGLLPPEKWIDVKESMHNLTEDGLYTATELDFSTIFSDNLTLSVDDVIISDTSSKILSFVEGGDKYSYYFSNKFYLKLGRVIADRYAYLILCFIFSVLIAIIIVINKSNFEKMKNSSHYDSLTKTYTRRQGFIMLEEYVSKIQHYKNICLCFIDINGLKEVNDTLGHPFGDELIVTVSDTIKDTIRQEDIVIRMGGDEFLIVFMKVEKAIAETIWFRIADSFRTINSTEDRGYEISVSHGIVEIVNRDKKVDLSTLITEADGKMYKEKIRIKKNLKVLRDKS